jgi:hypothetical protein
MEHIVDTEVCMSKFDDLPNNVETVHNTVPIQSWYDSQDRSVIIATRLWAGVQFPAKGINTWYSPKISKTALKPTQPLIQWFFRQGSDSCGKSWTLISIQRLGCEWVATYLCSPFIYMTHWLPSGQFYPSRHICKLKKVNISFVMWIPSVCPSTQNNSNPTGWTYIKFHNIGFFLNKICW